VTCAPIDVDIVSAAISPVRRSCSKAPDDTRRRHKLTQFSTQEEQRGRTPRKGAAT